MTPAFFPKVITGPPGPKGDTGPAGATGPQGDTGPQGPAGFVLHKIPFAVDSPAINTTGYPVYTPAPGEYLLYATLIVETAWDGITPKADVGSFITQNYGWFNTVDMTDTGNAWDQAVLFTTVSTSSSSGLFRTADLVKVIVTQDGEKGGANPGSTRGSGFVVLAIA